jgi:hypothetical protein
MKTPWTLCLFLLLSAPAQAAGTLAYFTDAEAHEVADQLIEKARSAEPVDRMGLLSRAALIGHPDAMMLQCRSSNGGGPRWMRYEGIAWCRIIEANAPADLGRLHDAARAQLQAVAASINAGDESAAQQAESVIRGKLARPWREAEAAAAAKATPLEDAISIGSNGAPSSMEAVKMYLDAVSGHDRAALDRVVNPLDMLRLNNSGEYGAWSDAQFKCTVTLRSGPMAPPKIMLQVYRYRKYPLETADITKKCGGTDGSRPLVLGTILITVQLKGRWFVTTDSI